ncbi:hypothetical protein ACJIZ3_008985 [Penstemon smallii]|uniref:Uncharacterized protein n=1 Tax=Penstemon smallii TaxID=265156 RepID=A0ABD3TB93_9LAMI
MGSLGVQNVMGPNTTLLWQQQTYNFLCIGCTTRKHSLPVPNFAK